MSSSISFISKIPSYKVNFGNFLSSRRRRTTTTIEMSYNDSLIQVNRFDKSPLSQLGSISDESFRGVSLEKGKINELGFVEEVELMDEIKVFVERLETVVEKIRVLEMEKFMSRDKKGGGISVEEKEEAEIMIREIVNKFLEKPIKYLSCGDGKLEDKLKDLKILVKMLENSCLGKQNVSNNNLCLRHSFS